MTLRAGLDVAYAALCPACQHKALTGESQLAAQNPLAREEHFRRLNIVVCLTCEEAELARRFQRAAQQTDGQIETEDGRVVLQLPMRSRSFWGF